MNWSRKHTLIAGLGLIIATNAVALLGVAWNRAGEPDSSLLLSQRELRIPNGWSHDNENSGLSLVLNWRVLPSEGGTDTWLEGTYDPPEWLDADKLGTLGFPPAPERSTNRETTQSDHELLREVLLVLELNGPTYQRALARITRQAERHHDDEEARNALRWEQSKKSRLFVVDAGLDHKALRNKYADRSRYAIVHGKILRWRGGTTSNARVLITLDINVPLQWRTVFGGVEMETIHREHAPSAYVVRVDFGKRLEPWITHAETTNP